MLLLMLLYTKFEFRRPYHSEDIRHFVCENYSVCDPDLVVGNLPTNFGVSTAFRSRVMDRHASDWSRDLVTLEFHLGGYGTCE